MENDIYQDVVFSIGLGGDTSSLLKDIEEAMCISLAGINVGWIIILYTSNLKKIKPE